MQEKIRPGYKQTEVGMIPDDWELRALGEVVQFLDGQRRPVKSGDRAKMKGIYPYYGASGIVDYVNGYLFDDDLILLGEDGENILSRNLPLAFRVSGKVWVNNHAHVMKPLSSADIDFLTAYLESLDYRDYNTGTAQPKLNKQSCLRIPVALPPIEEQRAIAQTLSNADARIAGLEAVIAKKRDLKHAAMQQLLTGKTRLLGFSGEWEVKRLGELAHIKTGKRNNQDKKEAGDFPFFVRSETVERIDSYSHDCEAILVPGEGNIGNIFHYINGKFDVHQRVYAITQFAENVSGKYVHLWMRMNFGAHAMQNTVKATVDSLRLPTFQNFQLLMPPTIDEQTAIAEILSDMDAELAALDAEAEKARTIKQGMMQNLLTGKVRLV